VLLRKPATSVAASSATGSSVATPRQPALRRRLPRRSARRPVPRRRSASAAGASATGSSAIGSSTVGSSTATALVLDGLVRDRLRDDRPLPLPAPRRLAPRSSTGRPGSSESNRLADRLVQPRPREWPLRPRWDAGAGSLDNRIGDGLVSYRLVSYRLGLSLVGHSLLGRSFLGHDLGDRLLCGHGLVHSGGFGDHVLHCLGGSGLVRPRSPRLPVRVSGGNLDGLGLREAVRTDRFVRLGRFGGIGRGDRLGGRHDLGADEIGERSALRLGDRIGQGGQVRVVLSGLGGFNRLGGWGWRRQTRPARLDSGRPLERARRRRPSGGWSPSRISTVSESGVPGCLGHRRLNNRRLGNPRSFRSLRSRRLGNQSLGSGGRRLKPKPPKLPRPKPQRFGRGNVGRLIDDRGQSLGRPSNAAAMSEVRTGPVRRARRGAAGRPPPWMSCMVLYSIRLSAGRAGRSQGIPAQTDHEWRPDSNERESGASGAERAGARRNVALRRPHPFDPKSGASRTSWPPPRVAEEYVVSESP